MSEGQKPAKKQEDEVFIRFCDKCTKGFTAEHSYLNHMKTKHNYQKNDESEQEQQQQQGYSEQEEERHESKNNVKKSKNIPIRSRMLEIQRNELEDNIYTFLGELGEKNAQPQQSRQIINFTNDQKLTGQTNYAVNRVIRTPYEEQIKCSQEVTAVDLQKSQHSQFLRLLHEQLAILQDKVEQEKQIWELRDPMAPEEEVADQFSLMDIRKLIQNYPKRQVNIKHPHFSIFLLWIGRICKSPAFKQFFTILGQYLAKFELAEPNRQKNDQEYQTWKNYYKVFESSKLGEQSLNRFQIFDEKSIKKFVDYFVQWTDLFRALSI